MMGGGDGKGEEYDDTVILIYNLFDVMGLCTFNFNNLAEKI